MNALCYDHREDQGKSPTAAKWRALLSKLGANTFSQPPYDIVVAHGTPEKARYLIRKEPLQSDVTEHHYVLICGTEGVRDHPPCSFNVGGKVVLVFPVTKECDAISLGEWRLLFEWLVTVVNKKCSSLDEASDLAESRILPLIGLVDQTIPSAFSILCQGYLATCGERVNDESRANTSPRMNVRDGRWWLMPFRKACGTKSISRLRQLIQQRWSDYPPEVGALLKLIESGQVDQTAVVMSAYNAIHAKVRFGVKAGNAAHWDAICSTASSGKCLAIAPPKKIFLVGDGLECEALAQCLSLFANVERFAPTSVQAKSHLFSDDHEAVTVLGGSNNDVWIHLTHIRSEQRWMGRIVIVLSPDKKPIFDACIFIRRQSSQEPSHGFLPEPVLLGPLFQIASSLTPFGPRGFENYLKRIRHSWFGRALTTWKTVQRLSCHEARQEKVARQLAKMILRMDRSVKKSLLSHEERNALRKWSERAIWMSTLETVITRNT